MAALPGRWPSASTRRRMTNGDASYRKCGAASLPAWWLSETQTRRQLNGVCQSGGVGIAQVANSEEPSAHGYTPAAWAVA